jgi:hypothetical protein
MRRDDLPTVGYLDECFRTILGHIEALKRPAATAGPEGPAVLLSIEQVMERLEVSRSAVQRWIKNGKRGRVKQMIKLPVLTFGEGQPRIPWPALLAFGRGETYDLTKLPAPQPVAALSAPPNPETNDLPPMRLVG